MIRFLALFFASVLLGLTARGDVTGLRFAGDGELTRVIIDVSGPQRHEAFLISDDGARLIVDMPGADLALNIDRGPGGGAVNEFHWDNGQLVFDLAGPMMIARMLDLPPAGHGASHRIVMDLSAVSEARFQKAARADMKRLTKYRAAATAPVPVQQAETTTKAPRQLKGPVPIARPAADGTKKYIIVIDPGHGGKDPGASHHGAIERTIVLKSALTLKAMLERNARYTVHLTREDDTFIELEDRVAMAREWGADLFVSIHADAAANKDVKGATVYKLSPKGQRRSESMSKRQQWDIPLETGTSQEVNGILSDLIKRETKSNSAIFAESVLTELAKAGPALRKTPSQKNLFVLLAPDVPAVLVEIGFLTNAKDARRLKSASGRKRSMAAINRAIDAYFSDQDLKYAQN